MNQSAHHKVKAYHLKRDAYLYVRQSTLRQVFENTESTRRQYGLKQRAVALGWAIEQVVVIDCDLGQSAASSAVDREGFKKLVAEVGMGKAGIVLGLEVSRLARSSTDWHRLLEICALTDTLIMDEDGIYDPAHFNDRLLLGLKGTMSEAELHVLRARLQGGILSKAGRGELKTPLPVGLVYDGDGRVILDPDKQVQQVLRLLFDTFRRTGSAWATARAFREQGFEFPHRVRTGPNKGELAWGPLLHGRVRQVLRNPRYAGAFCFGKTRTRKTADGKSHVDLLPRDEWGVLIPDTHPGYISWDEYGSNVGRLEANARTYGTDRRKSPPGEGPALLQGPAICGICGDRMTVRYHRRSWGLTPEYMCQRHGIEHGEPACQQVPGAGVDEAIGDLLVEAVTPLALEVALSIQEELKARAEDADRLRQKQVERARYEADLAQRRYMRVDPDNRLVADELEATWNEKLKALSEAQEEHERGRKSDHCLLDEEQRSEVLNLATDFPRLWHDPKTPHRERKRMARLILEDVTLIKREGITMHVRFRGGATRTLRLPIPLRSYEMRRTDPRVVKEIERLFENHTDGEVAAILNEQGMVSGTGVDFHSKTVARIRREYGLKDRFSRLREEGMLTGKELADLLGVSTSTINLRRRRGLLTGHRYNDKCEYLYEAPTNNGAVEQVQETGLMQQALPDGADEVQYGT